MLPSGGLITKNIQRQLSESLRGQIISGKLAQGERIPSTRALAQTLGIARATVVAVYGQLEAEGYLTAKPRSGFAVADTGSFGQPFPPDTKLSASRKAPNSDYEHEPLLLAPGLPDMREFPSGTWAKFVARSAREEPALLVQSDSRFGDTVLRSSIAKHLAQWRGVKADPEQIIITAGALNALEICIRLLCDSAATIGLENPGYRALSKVVEEKKHPAFPLDVDEDGAILPRTRNDEAVPKIVVLTPSHQHPLGGTMPLLRRREFIEWANAAKSWIIEDDYDSEFRYAGSPIPALQGLDIYDRTIYIGSFSKTFSAGLRLGYLVLPKTLSAEASRLLSTAFPAASAAAQRPLGRFMADGQYSRHIRRIRRKYAERYALLVELLTTNLPDLQINAKHHAGMHLTAYLPSHVNDIKFADEARKTGLGIDALSPSYFHGMGRPGLVLGFCAYTEDELRSGVKRLCDVYKYMS